MVEHHVVTDLRRLTDHDAGAVVDEEAPADARTGVNLDAGRDEASELRDQAGQKGHTP